MLPSQCLCTNLRRAARGDAGLADQQAVCGERRQPLGSGEVDAEIAKVAIVDPDQRRFQPQRPAELDGVHDAAAVLRRHLWIYGVGGILVPFPGIKIIDMILVALKLV